MCQIKLCCPHKFTNFSIVKQYIKLERERGGGEEDFMFIFSLGEVLVGHAPDTQQLLYESDGPDKTPGYIYGTLYITNHRLSFRPAPFHIEKVIIIEMLPLF